MAPHHPMVVEALESLSYAYAYLDRSREERATYHRFIPLVTDDLTKAVAMLNLAEAEMHLGNMEDAVAGYRDTIALAGQIPNSMSAGGQDARRVGVRRSARPRGAIRKERCSRRRWRRRSIAASSSSARQGGLLSSPPTSAIGTSPCGDGAREGRRVAA